MVLKKIHNIRWEEVVSAARKAGVELTMDAEIKSTASGYRDGGRFCFCWLEPTPTATLEIDKISALSFPAEDPLVKAISELLLGSPPFCMYRNSNRRGLLILEWRKEEYQEARKDILQNMKNVYEFVDL